MIRRVSVHNFHGLTESGIVLQELADLVKANLRISYHFKKGYERTPIQKKVKDIIDGCELKEGRVLHLLLYGSVGSGKTTAALGEIMDIMLDYPGTNALAVRRTYGEIEAATWKDTKAFCDKFGIDYKTNVARFVLTMANGSVIRFMSADRTATSKSDKANALGGTAYSVALLDEADEIPKEFAKTVAGRMRENKGVKRKIIVYICNPPSKDHWLYQLFFNNPDWDSDDPASPYRALHMPTSENLMHVGEHYLDDIHENYRHNPALYLRMVQGQFGPAVKGLPVFANTFDKSRHVADTNIADSWNKDYPIYRCWDFGWRRPACVLFQDDKVRGQLRVFRADLGYMTWLERFAEDMLDAHHELFPGADWIDVADIAGNQHCDRSQKTSIDILRSFGLRPKTRRTKIAYGLNLLSEQLRRYNPPRHGTKSVPSFVIDPRCTDLIDAFAYGFCADESYAESGEHSGQEVKINKDGFYEHIMDALRYGIVLCRRPGRGASFEPPNRDKWKTVDVDNGNKIQWDRGSKNRRGRSLRFGGRYSI